MSGKTNTFFLLRHIPKKAFTHFGFFRDVERHFFVASDGFFATAIWFEEDVSPVSFAPNMLQAPIPNDVARWLIDKAASVSLDRNGLNYGDNTKIIVRLLDNTTYDYSLKVVRDDEQLHYRYRLSHLPVFLLRDFFLREGQQVDEDELPELFKYEDATKWLSRTYRSLYAISHYFVKQSPHGQRKFQSVAQGSQTLILVTQEAPPFGCAFLVQTKSRQKKN